MQGRRNNAFNQCLATSLTALSVALVAFLTYRDVLNYFFTGTDLLTLIDAGRVHSLQDLVRIFTEPLMNGTSFAKESRFYRPIATLSYSLDYAVWQLNPLGYHLTDLVLHVSVTVLIFFLIRSLTKGKQVTAWLSAIVFTTHPILVECVPAAARHDIMAALFLLLSLLLFFKYLSAASYKSSYLFFSVFCYALAFGAKEIGIILPFLIVVYLITCTGEPSFFKNRIAQAAKVGLPYFTVTFVLLAWRTYVLQGTGGYTKESLGVLGVIQRSTRTIKEYFVDLLYPFGKSPFDAIPGTFEQVGSLIALLSLFTLLVFYRQDLSRLGGWHSGKAMRALKILLTMAMVSSLAGIFSYPLIAPHLNHLIRQAYAGEGLNLLASAMENRGATPIEYYFYQARDQIFRLLSYSLSLSAIGLIGLIGAQQRHKIRTFFVNWDDGKLVIFLLVWLFLPLGIYLFLLEHSHRSMYIPIIPFSAILSIILVETSQSTLRIVKEYHSAGTTYTSLLRNYRVAGFIITLGLFTSLFAYSPLLRTNGEYGEWKDSGKIWAMFLHKLSGVVVELPDDAAIHIFNLPERISSYQKIVPHAKSVSPLGGYSIKSWLDLNHPTNRLEVFVPCLSWYAATPSKLDLQKIEDGNDVTIIVKPDVDTSDCQNIWSSPEKTV